MVKVGVYVHIFRDDAIERSCVVVVRHQCQGCNKRYHHFRIADEESVYYAVIKSHGRRQVVVADRISI